MSRTQNELNV